MASSTTNTASAQAGPKRTYIRKPDPKRRGVGMRPEDLDKGTGMCVWSPNGTEPYATVPSEGDPMTLHASAVPGNTLSYNTLSYAKRFENSAGVQYRYECRSERAAGGRAGSRWVKIHDVAMPSTPEGMENPPRFLVCSLPLVGATGVVSPSAAPSIETPMPTTDLGLVERTRKLVEQFRQVILYGPPGTGKTRLARQVALSLLDRGKATPDVLENDELLRDALETCSEGSFDFVVFHPSYEYEQFIGGITADTSGDNLRYLEKDGVFVRLCNAKRAVLVIDEINRGNLSKLLGELVYALEYRDSKVTLPFVRQSGPHKGTNVLVIPRELFVIATMNSSDRSIGQIDVAVRRRFGLLPIPPDPEVVRQVWKKQFPRENEGFAGELAQLMKQINADLRLRQDSVELGVGQSYFLPGTDSAIYKDAQEVVRNRWKYQVRPLLAEYDVMADVHLSEHLKADDLDAVLGAQKGRGEVAPTS